MAQWRSAAVALERIRADEFRVADLARTAAQFDAMSLELLRNSPPGPVSGLIEQQRLFRRAPRG
jgi:hypothetical protein